MSLGKKKGEQLAKYSKFTEVEGTTAGTDRRINFY